MADRLIYGAIIGVMKDIGAIGKDSENSQQHFKYRGIDAVMNALQPALIKNKVFVIPEVLSEERSERKTDRGGTLFYTRMKINYRFMAEDGSFVEASVIGEAMDSGDKASNKAMSVAYKYACFQVFCIPTEDEPDAESHEDVIPESEMGDASLVPKEGQIISAEEVEKLKAELDRTGIKAETIVDMFHVNTVEEMSQVQYVVCMNKFKKTPDKKV